MSLTYGFYNSINHDRLYDATQLSSIFDGIIRDGVYESIGEKFAVKYNASNAKAVVVGSGRAWFDHTWSYNDTDEPILLEPPEDRVLFRIDALVLEIASGQENRKNSFKIVKGTPASSPQKPSLTKTEGLSQYPLAYLRIPPADSSEKFSQANITNAVGTSECPYVTGLMQVNSIDQMVSKWDSDFNNWNNEKRSAFNAWFDALQSSLSGDVAANLSSKITAVDDKTKRFYNKSVTWASNTNSDTKADYPYIGTISCVGVTSNYSADVRLPYKAISEGWIASITNTDIDKVYIYSNTSSADMGSWTVPVIICDKIT